MSFEQTQEFLAPAVQFAFNSIGAGAVAGRSVELINQFNDKMSVAPDAPAYKNDRVLGL